MRKALWALTAACAVALIAAVVVVDHMHRGRGRTVNGCWQLMEPGSWPWGAGPDSANDGGYACEIPEGRVQRWDTLFGSTYTTSGSAICTLHVWTLIRFGSAAPTIWSHATCRIIASTDDGQTWRVLRGYGHRDFSGHEAIGLPSWATGRPRVRLAWACHVYDSINLRYWCIDRVLFRTTDRPTSDCGVTGVLFPRPGQAIPPLEDVPVIVTVTNSGTLAADTNRLAVHLESGNRGYADTMVAIPYDQRVPVELRLPWSDEDTGQFTLGVQLYGRQVGNYNLDQIPENDTMTVRFAVRANCWQRLGDDYPYPRSLVPPGLATAGSSDGAVYVRSPDTPDGALVVYSPIRDEWRQLPAGGLRVRSHGRASPQSNSGVVADDTSVYFLVGRARPLAKYDIQQGLWHETSLPGVIGDDRSVYFLVNDARPYLLYPGQGPPRRVIPPGNFMIKRRIDDELADGICVDQGGRIQVLGKRNVFVYYPTDDRWGVLGDSSPFEWEAPCGNYQGCVYINDDLVTVLSDGRMVGCNTRGPYWSEYDSLPSFDPREVCRMAADPENSLIYFLSGSGLKKGVVFAAYNIERDSWLLDLPQPFAGTSRLKIRPGAQLVRAGRWLYAMNGGSTEVWTFNLPSAHRFRSRSGW